jgi:extradiol dioxygenase family protein
MKTLTLKEAVALLREASGVIHAELDAAGADEVKGHPVLADHLKVVQRIDRAIARAQQLEDGK